MVKAIALFSHSTGSTDVYYNLPVDQTIPGRYGTIDEGEVVELLGLIGDPAWIKFKRINGQILYAPLRRSDVATANLTNVTAVPLINSGLEAPGDLAVYAVLYTGVKVHSEPDGNATELAKLPAGTVLHVTKTVGVGAPTDGFVEINFLDGSGAPILAYVDTINAGAVKTYTFGQTYTQWLILLPDAWADVPKLTAETPEQPNPPTTTPTIQTDKLLAALVAGMKAFISVLEE